MFWIEQREVDGGSGDPSKGTGAAFLRRGLRALDAREPDVLATEPGRAPEGTKTLSVIRGFVY